MRLPIRSILCAVDFSKFTEPMLQAAAAVALRFDAGLHLFHSVYIPQDALYRTPEFERSGEQAQRVDDAQKRISQLMGDRPVKWTAEITVGEPVDAIVRASEADAVDLVITAGHTMRGLKRMLLGKIVERLPRQLKKPHLVVRSQKGRVIGTLPDTLHRIMVCCDATEKSMPVFQYAFAFAEAFQAPVEIVHTLEAPLAPSTVAPGTGHYGEVQEKLEKQLSRRIESLAASCAHPKTPFTVHLLHGHPGDELKRFAEKHQADLLVVGVRHHTKFEMLLIGSTTETLLRSGPCSVLTIPAGEGSAL